MQWERDLLAFVARELRGTPARWRATLRVVVVTTLAVIGLNALHVPEGEFMFVSLFVVSVGNAGASFEKGVQRLVATIFGGGVAILVIAVCADKPWLMIPLHVFVITVALFLTRTTTAPYAFLLFAITFVMVVPFYSESPSTTLDTALWRMLLTAVGVVMGTAGQMLLWPDDPEDLLLDDLAARLEQTAGLLDRLATERTGAPAPDDDVGAAGVAAQLDLVRQAETKSRWLRQRHAEQVELITNVQLLVTAARRLNHVLAGRAIPPWGGQRLAAVSAACLDDAAALRARRPLPAAAVGPDVLGRARPDDATALATLAALHEMERALGRMPAATQFLAGPDADVPIPKYEMMAEPGLWTPQCTLRNYEAIRFGLKAAIAASICGVIIEMGDWQGLSTAVISCVVVAQSFFGAGFRKGILRIAGAVVGGVLAIVVVAAVMPNAQTLGSALIPLALCFAAAGWVLSGSSRINYVGLQMVIVLGLTLINPEGPTIDLAPVGNRITGILLGIVVMAIVDVYLWPVFGPMALRRGLGEALRQMAVLHRASASGDVVARRTHAFGVYRTINDVLAMHDDLLIEPEVRPGLAAERDALLRVLGAVERVFLDVLAVARHRPETPAPELAGLDDATAAVIAALGVCLRTLGPVPATIAPEARRALDVPDAPIAMREMNETYTRLLASIDVLRDDLIGLEALAPALAAEEPGRRRPGHAPVPIAS